MDRLTVATTVEAGERAVELPQPVFLRAGDHVWVQGGAVHGRRRDGAMNVHEGDGYWLCR